MNTEQQQPLDRRQTDTEGFKELVRKVELLQDRVAALERTAVELTTAFPKDDLEKPDYSGHRKDHVYRIKAAAVMEGYKVDAAKKVIAIVVIFVAGLLTSGWAEYVKTALKGTGK